MIFYLLPTWCPGLFVGVIQVWVAAPHRWWMPGAFAASPEPTYWSVFDLETFEASTKGATGST